MLCWAYLVTFTLGLIIYPPFRMDVRAAYLDGGPIPSDAAYEGGVSVHLLFRELSDGIVAELVPRGGYEWHVRYEANTAYGFWLRRRADGTVALFSDGLRDVIETLDSAWMADFGA